MKKMSAEQIRETWLNFFKSKGHHIEPSSSLIPKNDPTLLWINAGVAALKKYFDGSEIPPCKRITNVQKSLRTNDIENVGFTDRHQTFFEMLGNFSIGDYFKKEAIAYGFELLTSPSYFGFDKDKLYMTYFPDDLEAKKYWMDNGVEESHLIPMPTNFWEIGSGPCGPDSEIFYDRGEKYDPNHVGIKLLKDDIENDRYIEIWNIVFSQFNSEEGKKRSEYKELPSKNIDTGAGLERFACILQETESNFETDLFWPIILEIEKHCKKEYQSNKPAFRIIADHVRSCSFAIADGENFSNEGRGYVLRRLIRRAERYCRVLGIDKPFLYELVDIVVDIMKPFYGYIEEKKDYIKRCIKSEEEKFIRTLYKGEALLKNLIEGKTVLSGTDMFKLYDTYGFPKELTIEICKEKGVSVDLKSFEIEMNAQKERARLARSDYQSMNKQSEDLMKFTQPSVFSYDKVEVNAKVIGLFVDGQAVSELTTDGDIIFDKTVCYAESGGQVCDSGEIVNNETQAKITNVIKAPNKQPLHHVELAYGSIKLNDTFTVKIDLEKRTKIARNHSSVHLLQAALTKVLGDHIAQKGSYVCDEYIHFDFSHDKKLTLEEITLVEKIVNQWICNGIKNETNVLPIEEAKKLGARALFDDKYGDVVRVVCFGDISKEFCGGTHVLNTQDIGVFVIESEGSVASGIRRIVARTSFKAYELLKNRESILISASNLLNCLSYSEVLTRLNTLKNDKVTLKLSLEKLEIKLSNSIAKELLENVKTKDGVNYIISSIKGNRQTLLSVLEYVKSKINDYLVVLIGDDDTLPIIVSCNGKALEKYKSGLIVKDIATLLKGSGGGKPDFASGAGKDRSLIKDALEKATQLAK